MTLNVLIVDDSSFFQRCLKNIINEHPQLNVVGVADNGREAIEKVKTLKPDVVTMDYEMPMMDGVTAVRTIMADHPLPILMLSSMTYEGARITLDALEAGAVDFMTKNFAEISNNSPAIKARIYESLLTIGARALKSKSQNTTATTAPRVQPSLKSEIEAEVEPRVELRKDNSSAEPKVTRSRSNTAPIKKPSLVAIGASTGGPAALTELLKNVPASFSLPMLIIQHMPETFTRTFASRLNQQCQITVKQAETGDELTAGVALLAPGGKQLIVDPKNTKRIKVIDSTKPVNYKPSVDVTFASLANTYGSNTLAVVLTGMGNDGCDGARLLKGKHAQVWTQSEESCLIYGMPMSIDQANLSDRSLDLQQINQHLSQWS